MTPRRLLVITPRELTRDVRARRQVDAARAAGLSVVGLSSTIEDERPVELNGVEIVRVAQGRISGGLRRAGLGGMRRSRPPVRELRGLWRLLRLAKTTVLLTRAGRSLGTFDLVHVNDLDALPTGYLLARRDSSRLFYDAHELYRFMEADPPRLYTAVISALEGWLARRADTVVTNCDLFASELARLLRLKQTPAVVLNCPDPVEQLPPHVEAGGRLRVIYQAAADHEGRPVADLLAATSHAPDIDVTIRLVDVDRERLGNEIRALGIDDRVHLSDPVEPNRLVEGMAGFDVGVILNRDVTPNDALAVPGKLWEYMMAALGTVAPKLPGLALVEELGVGLVFSPGRPDELGRRLQELAVDRDLLARIRARSRELALAQFNSVTQAVELHRIWNAPS